MILFYFGSSRSYQLASIQAYCTSQNLKNYLFSTAMELPTFAPTFKGSYIHILNYFPLTGNFSRGCASTAKYFMISHTKLRRIFPQINNLMIANLFLLVLVLCYE